ncbi:GGDEF domain-containing protein [uncultured Castellaniella sp.]|uniref:GGDEF domain-containing protein n=1 Tax=uncultured Castellaniella sp. TaxID=647907 RepID=UPI00262A2300|nr:GGDEF domain-containing protein [uncultured Castellaniella sp.]
MSFLPDSEPAVCLAPQAAPGAGRPDDPEDVLSCRLDAVFQPIVWLREGSVLGHEGLIRGPQGSPLHFPDQLFASARAQGRDVALEHRACRTVVRRFSELALPGRLFLNISPQALLAAEEHALDLAALLRQAGLDASRLVIELTEQSLGGNWPDLASAIARLQAQGAQFAIDDLGAGFSNLGRWVSLRPKYIKTDKSFIRGIQDDLLRQQMLRSISDIAAVAGAIVVAEGIESLEELACARDQGIACVQGYYIERPQAQPTRRHWPDLLADVSALRLDALHCCSEPGLPQDDAQGWALQLLRRVDSVTSKLSSEAAFSLFLAKPDLYTIPVVEDGIPVGVLKRSSLVERFSLPFQRELYGGRPCRLFMDSKPLIVDMHTPLLTLSRWLAETESHALATDFIITARGHYLGIGSSRDLLQALNRLQLRAARHANPLTQLPGNVPIDRQIQRYLASGLRFAVCYADLDHFKPFNDVFGYRMGDDVIRLLSQVLSQQVDGQQDFLGHIGGDDFIVLFRSGDWQQRCRRMIESFHQGMAQLMVEAGRGDVHGYVAEDRQGQPRHYDLPALSLGAVPVEPGAYHSRHQIAQAASEAKSQAKKQAGSSLFIERRAPTGAAA